MLFNSLKQNSYLCTKLVLMAKVTRMAQWFTLSFRRFRYHSKSRDHFHLPVP